MGSYTSVINDSDDMKMRIRYAALEKVFSAFAKVGAHYTEMSDDENDLGDLAGAIRDIVKNDYSDDSESDSEGGTRFTSRVEIEQAAKSASLTTCGPRETYTSNKLSLSLVHQANLLVTKELGNGKLGIWQGSFTVWSGVTAGSTLEYNLSEYLSKLQYSEQNF